MTCYPKLSDWINDWFGTSINLPVQTFGFFVALAFAVGGWMLVRALKRKEREGLLQPRPERFVEGAPATPSEILVNAVVGGLLGFKLVPALRYWNEFSDNPQEFLFSGNGSLVGALVGALLLGGLRWWEKRRRQLPEPVVRTVSVWPHERIGDLVTVAAVAGILGARLMVLIENGGWEDFLRNPGANFFSGLSIYGGLLLGIPAVILFARRQGIPVLPLGDAAAPAVMAAYAVGRMGCQVSGDGDWGVVNTAPKPGWLSWAPDWLWAYDYPNNVNRWCSPTGPGPDAPPCSFELTPHLVQPVFPTPVYEILMVAVIVAVLLWAGRRLKAPGALFGLFFAVNGVERLLIEQIRINTPYPNLLNLTQAEIVAGLFIAFGLGLFAWAWRRHPGPGWGPPSAR